MSEALRSFTYRRQRKNLTAGFDPVLTFAVLALLIIGTVLVYAATRNWFAAAGEDPQYYLKRHGVNVVIGIALAMGITFIDYRILRAYTPFVWGAGVFGLIAVLIPGIGSTINGARAWIVLPGGFSLQPAELAKITIIIGMSMILTERIHGQEEVRNKEILQALAVAAIPVLLIVAQPDMGTILIISAIVVTIIATSGAQARWVAGLLVLAFIGGFIAVKAGVVNDYQLQRLQSFVNPNADMQGTGYQLRQARITVGSGGLFGTGLFEGPQTNGRFVPEQQTDFIFTVAGEQTGFLGSSIILLLLITIMMRGFSIARRTTDPFGRLVAVGVVAWFAFQTFENIGMTLGLMPMTGVPLPFLSYGGSSMFANMIGIGLLQNVHARLRG
jgi:rod shape determining protein RodA